MNKPIRAFLHIPTFHDLVPVRRDAETGKWSLDSVPSTTRLALGSVLFETWKSQVLSFMDSGVISGMPKGLAFELLAIACPDTDPLCLQAFGGEVLRILDSGGNASDEALIRESAVNLGLAHVTPDGKWRPGEEKLKS